MTEADLRSQMIEILGRLGVAPDDVPRDQGEAAALASDVILTRGERYSLRDLARIHDLPIEIATEPLVHLGIQAGDPDAVRFDDADLAMATFLYEATQSILTEAEGREMLHVVGTSLATIAEAAVASHVQGPERRAQNMVEVAILNTAVAELGLELAGQLAAVFRHHLRQAAISNRRTQNQVQRSS
ncbi:MAG: hypothetical protein R2695_03835 [Acidimicrobiales bacterium]